MTDNATAATPRTRQGALGLPLLAMIGLAALAVPRVILHDLHLIGEWSPVTWLLSLLPVAVWIAVAVLKRVPHPFVTVLMIGVFYGVMLVITHQLLWEVAFDGRTISLGDGPVGLLVPRIAAIPSGLFTGAAIGAIGGLIAAGIQAVARRNALSA
ncbi:hypothetical protein [Agromyces sp. NPDC049794]|uniref:hypothetical protein n=1 Tax=unclassified Agromyces TaxID=2639701 RepID=UPI003404B30B